MPPKKFSYEGRIPRRIFSASLFFLPSDGPGRARYKTFRPNALCYPFLGLHRHHPSWCGTGRFQPGLQTYLSTPEEWHCKYDCGPTLDETVGKACIYIMIEGSHCTLLKIDGSGKIAKEMRDACWENCFNSNDDICTRICTSFPAPTATATATGLPQASGFMRDVFWKIED